MAGSVRQRSATVEQSTPALLSFDAPRLLRDLKPLPPLSRVAFAASCAERLWPAFDQYHRENRARARNPMRQALDAIWQELRGGSLSDSRLQGLYELCSDAVPVDDPDWPVISPFVEDSALAAVAVLRARISGDPREAIEAARHTYDAADQYAIFKTSVDLSSRAVERKVQAHPVVQAELWRQQQDLEELHAAYFKRRGLAETCQALRDRAREASLVFYYIPPSHGRNSD